MQNPQHLVIFAESTIYSIFVVVINFPFFLILIQGIFSSEWYPLRENEYSWGIQGVDWWRSEVIFNPFFPAPLVHGEGFDCDEHRDKDNRNQCCSPCCSRVHQDPSPSCLVLLEFRSQPPRAACSKWWKLIFFPLILLIRKCNRSSKHCLLR